jgi:replicative DNA helicase
MDAGNVGVRTLAQVLPDTMRDLEAFVDAPEGLTGLPTDLPDFDRLTGGLRPGTLTIVGGLPGRGKSVLCKQLAVSAARRGAKVLFLGMEMEPKDIAGRMLLAEAEVDKWDLRVRGDSTWPKVLRARDRLLPLPILFDPRESPTLGQIRATAKQTKGSKGLDLLIVDYLQRCSLDQKLEQWQAIGEVAKGLKSLSRSLGIPVLAACQLRAEADDKNRVPTMSDFAGARQVIQAEADLITLLHPEDGENWRDHDFPAFRLIVPKHRNGATSTGLMLSFEKATSRFLTMAGRPEVTTLREVTR